MSSGVTMPNPDEKDIVDETAAVVERPFAEIVADLQAVADQYRNGMRPFTAPTMAALFDRCVRELRPHLETLERLSRERGAVPDDTLVERLRALAWSGCEGLADDIVAALRTVELEAYERAAKVAEHEAEFRGDGDGEIWIAAKIAQAIRSLAVKEGER